MSLATRCAPHLRGTGRIRQQPVADNGDIVAALIDGEATVKTYKRREGHVWLMPHNPAYEPIPGDEATVLGRVVAVLRRV